MSATHDCIVVGSGPSGVASATALLAAGRSVLMVDVGLTLEPERERMLAEAISAGPLNATNAPWLSDTQATGKIPRKLIFGSDYPFRDAAEALRLRRHNVGAEPSFALGGLSNVWGAAALPFTADDTRDWPVSPGDLEQHYAACARLLGITGERDDLADLLPLYEEPLGQLRASRQAEIMLSALARNRERLAAKGVRFGRARVAARAKDCVYCGLCLHGCPQNLIYSANDTLRTLRANTSFSCRSDFVVETVSETESAATIQGLERGASTTLQAKSVFLAAGAIPTTAILLKSASMQDRPVRLLDSQYFVLPLALFKGAGRTRDEQLHTMAQIFVEVLDPAISPYTIHLQIYTYNSLLAGVVRAKLGKLMEPLARWGDAHFVLVQGYLHSDHSGAIDLTLRADGLDAVGVVNAEARRKIGALVRKLTLLAPRIGAVPLAPLMEISEPGRGFHIGGSFPMSTSPNRLQTDTLGRPFGWRRIHAVDATVLPSIPATTITYPVMANAHRIAKLAAKS